jgi:hypothetical protein
VRAWVTLKMSANAGHSLTYILYWLNLPTWKKYYQVNDLNLGRKASMLVPDDPSKQDEIDRRKNEFYDLEALRYIVISFC